LQELFIFFTIQPLHIGRWDILAVFQKFTLADVQKQSLFRSSMGCGMQFLGSSVEGEEDGENRSLPHPAADSHSSAVFHDDVP
jgi:hypothetical protein